MKKFYLLFALFAWTAMSVHADEKTYNFPSDGSFSEETVYGSTTYYKTWKTTDGNLTISGSNEYAFYKSGSWYYLYDGTFTISAAEGWTVKEYSIEYPRGKSAAATFTDANGNATTAPDGEYGTAISVKDINGQSTTFTINTGELGYFGIYKDYAKFTITGSGGGGGQGTGGKTEYTLADGKLSDPYDTSSYAAYLKKWVSDDGVVTLSGSKNYNFYFSSGAGVAIDAGTYLYFYADRTYTVTLKDGYTLDHIHIASPYAYAAEMGLTASPDVNWSWPEKSYASDPSYMDLTANTFKIVGPNTQYAGIKASNFTIFIKDNSAGITEHTIVKPEADVIYDLQGRRVSQPAKGLYIINGKKVVVR